MFRFISGFFKILLASLLAGLVLAYLNIDPERIMADMGLTPEMLLHYLARGVSWALPHLIAGSVVIVPVWLVIYLFRPPRG